MCSIKHRSYQIRHKIKLFFALTEGILNGNLICNYNCKTSFRHAGEDLIMLSILVIDDEKMIFNTWKMLNEDGNCRFFWAPSVTEADRLLETQEFHVVLIDRCIGRDDGFEFARSLKKTHPDLIVYLVTGFYDSAIFAELQKAGIDGYFQKPGDIMKIVERIRFLDENFSVFFPTG